MTHPSTWAFRKGGTPASNQRARDAAAEARRVAKLPTPPTAYQPPAGVRHRTCQWPLWGDDQPAPKPPRYCGKPSETGCAYCQQHRDRARLRIKVKHWMERRS